MNESGGVGVHRRDELVPAREARLRREHQPAVGAGHGAADSPAHLERGPLDAVEPEPVDDPGKQVDPGQRLAVPHRPLAELGAGVEQQIDGHGREPTR